MRRVESVKAIYVDAVSVEALMHTFYLESVRQVNLILANEIINGIEGARFCSHQVY